MRKKDLKKLKLAVPAPETPMSDFLTASGTFQDGDLLLNRQGLRLISQENDESPPPIEPLDNQFTLADLETVSVIGKGSGGVVQLVRHKWTGQFFALKAIQMSIQESVRKQIVQELKINQASQCPNVVVCYHAFYNNGVISIVLEYMDCGSLADVIKRVKTFTEPYLAVICKQVLKGLIYLHRDRHIIHRDIKPSNLLVNHKGEVKITDFGVSATLAGRLYILYRIIFQKMLMPKHLAPSSLEIPNCFRLAHRDCSSILELFKPLQFANRRKYIQKSIQICTSINTICRATMQQQAESIGMRVKDDPDLMIVSDLDLTMVDHDDPSHQSLLNFNSLWAAEYAHNSTLVYSTGRSPQRYSELKRQVPLLTPAIVVLSVGTEILYGKSLEPDPSWIKFLDEGWDRDIVLEEAKRFAQLRLQEESEQRPHKISFYLDKQDVPRVQEELFSRLKQRGIDVKLIFSGGMAFDVLPKMGGKGEALAYLMRKMKKEGWLSKNVLVCGDSGNDTELFLVEGVNGVIVSNAQEELIQWYRSHNFVNNIYHASERCAGGIIQALEHYDFGPYNPPRKRIKDNHLPDPEPELQSGRLLDNGSAKREVIEFNIFLEMWLCGHIPDNDPNYQRVVEVIDNGATMVYPWGRESSLKESLDLVRQKHGLMSGKNFMTWIDNIEEKKLAEGVYLVTWESWEKFNGGEHKGYYATAILLSKEKTPNGVQWLRVHETSRNDE